MTLDEMPLDIWCLAQAGKVTWLAYRWYMRPWRARLLVEAQEWSRRSVEAREMSDLLDRIVGEAASEESCRHGNTLAELNQVVDRWRRGDV